MPPSIFKVVDFPAPEGPEYNKFTFFNFKINAIVSACSPHRLYDILLQHLLIQYTSRANTSFLYDNLDSSYYGRKLILSGIGFHYLG